MGGEEIVEPIGFAGRGKADAQQGGGWWRSVAAFDADSPPGSSFGWSVLECRYRCHRHEEKSQRGTAGDGSAGLFTSGGGSCVADAYYTRRVVAHRIPVLQSPTPGWQRPRQVQHHAGGSDHGGLCGARWSGFR